MKLSEYAKQHDIQYRTAWNRYKQGKIPGAYTDNTGHIIIPTTPPTNHNKAIIYARVSTHKQQKDLKRQAERLTTFANAQGLTITKIVTETASGVNDTRPKLTKLLQQDDWGTLIIEHKDRLTRVGYKWFETLLETQGKQIIIMNEAEEETADLMEDFVSIIYSFSARLYGLRSARRRTDKAIKALESSLD